MDSGETFSHRWSLPEYQYILSCGDRYWKKNQDILTVLPIPASEGTPTGAWRMVGLPDWASDIGVGSPPQIIVDTCCLREGDGPDYERCDWWMAAFLHISGSAEKMVEEKNGPVHSYAFRLKSLDPRLFDYAWVNRIFLFLRRWAARWLNRNEEDLFGSLPSASFFLTHDVDAIDNTAALQFKRAVLEMIKIGRSVKSRALKSALSQLSKVPGIFGTLDYWRIGEICDLENQYAVRSTFHFFSRPPGLSPSMKQRVVDPSYHLLDPRIRAGFRTLIDGHWEIGLHPSYDSWNQPIVIRREREWLENVSKTPIRKCRQHWLRFSWKDTWNAQLAGGLESDSTLGFNDRPGFRNGSALRFRPFSPELTKPLAFEAIPMMLMDAHFYDYAALSDEERYSSLSRWVNEVKAVHGEITVLWHQRVFHPSYGWGAGCRELLSLIA